MARENETPRGVAAQHGRGLDALLALNAHGHPGVQAADRLKAGTLVLLPPADAAAAGGDAAAPAGAPAPAAAAGGKGGGSKVAAALPHLGEQIEVEVADGAGHTSWKRAEVRRLLATARFSACVDEDEDFIEEYTLKDETKEWRRLKKAPLVRPSGGMPRLGDEVQVEVEEEGRTRWRRAEVRQLRQADGEAADGGDGGGGGGGDGGKNLGRARGFVARYLIS